MNLNALRNEIHQTAVDLGWWENGERNFGELLALVHSEVSEALEEWRKGFDPDYTYNGLSRGLLYKPEGIPSELADIIIRVLDICGFYDIDIQQIMVLKLEYNKTRHYRHGGKKA